MKETKETPKEIKITPSSSLPSLPTQPSTTTTVTTTPSTPPSTSISSSTSSSIPSSTTTKMSMPPLQNGPSRPIPKARYALKIRITNREYVPDLANEKSEYYQSFTKDLKSAVSSFLPLLLLIQSHLQVDKALSIKWKDVEMGRVLQYSKGSVVALVEVDALSSSPRTIEIKSVIEETAVRGSINGVIIEPTTVTVEQLRTFYDDESDISVVFHSFNNFISAVEQSSGPKEIENMIMDSHLLSQIGWLILAIVLLILVSICCICLFCRCRRVSHQFVSIHSIPSSFRVSFPHLTPSPSLHCLTISFSPLLHFRVRWDHRMGRRTLIFPIRRYAPFLV